MPYNREQMLDRKKLYSIHKDYGKEISQNILGEKIDQSQVTKKYRKVQYRTRNMKNKVGQVINDTREQRVASELQRQNKRLKQAGLTPFSDTEIAKVKNKTTKNLQ